MQFSDNIQSCLRLSDSVTQAFSRAGIDTIRDLLFHFPMRYEDRSHITPIAHLKDGQQALVHGKVLRANVRQGKRQMLEVLIVDAAGNPLVLRYFRFYPSQLTQFTLGRFGLFYGKVAWGRDGYEMPHPEITWLETGEQPVLPDTLQSIYPTVKGLSQIRWQQTIRHALSKLNLPKTDLLTEQGYCSFPQALQLLHQPQVDEWLPMPDEYHHPAKQRLILEELIAHQLSFLQARAEVRQLPAQALPKHSDLLSAFCEKLPFALTSAQVRVQEEIARDLSSTAAMMRLVQGDVGSGKTVVALMACLQAIAAGKQAVFMAPTELLAEQHAANMRKLTENLSITAVLLVGKLSAKEKRAALAAIADGTAQLIIGTHAVFQEQVCYHDLALVAIDEQHRFGVHQRLQLQEKAPKGYALHQLVLTATPIPRTLAMSAYGELETSIIDVLPAGRQPIRTSVMSNAKREAIIARIGEVCASGQQAYWVCPLIEESEVLECQNAQETAEEIRRQLPQVKVALIHGRLSADERRETMNAFAAGEIDLLVATTVIEVGVDVPNATIMIIENAERFGLSQLHQLRGRVGRGGLQSDCVLMYQAPLGETAMRRLNIMRATTDGFRIAEEDLAIRGAGELLGTRQTGTIGLKIADFERDAALLEKAERLAMQWYQESQPFADVLLERWMGQRSQYLTV
ncbi:ATP-dependent DNA helicase RecG [Suttonella ornithocola]|uniref:ATP-dependent DNA helicase RecG n=1 Tax=Suttonella ornithocola TaxID=279832 RepID=A0A380MLX1_9GAMM|nr:ATP-dependent DNA helicase RecG [Suttonella ornithocola]SUO93056.1 ATP-dependent DNA helicase recG [Suttonella ornithocola]